MAENKVTTYYKIEGVDKAIKDQNDLADAVANADKNLKEAQSKGGMFSKVLGGIGKVGKRAFQGIGTALKATGLGIFLDLGARLVEWFNQTDAGAKIIQGSLAVVGVVFEKIGEYMGKLIDYVKPLFEDPIQSIKDFGTAIAENITNRFVGLFELIPNLAKAVGELFKGNFSEAGTIALDAVAKVATGVEDFTEKAGEAFNAVAEEVGNVVEASVNAVKQSNALVDSQNLLKKRTGELAVENAKLNQELETQKKISEDTTRSYDERKAALDRVNAANEQLAANAVEQAQLERDAIQRALDLAKTDAERRDLRVQLNEAEAALIDTQTQQQIVRLESEQLNRELDQEELDRLEEIAQKKADADAEEAARKKEAREKELEAIKKQNEAILAAEIGLQEAKAAAFRGGIALASALAGENEKLQNAIFLVDKAVAAGKIIVDAVRAKAANLAYGATLGPIAGPIYTAAANQAVNLNTAAGLATIAAATIAKFKGGGSGGGLGPEPTIGGNFSVGAEAAGNFLTTDEAITQQQANITSIGQGGPVKTYVLAGDVTNAQEANKAIEDLATL